MIRDRFAFTIIYLVLSGCNPGSGWAANLILSNTNIVSEKTLLNQDAVISLENNRPRLKSPKTTDVQFVPQKLELEEKAIAPESLEPISATTRLWTLGGMALTSTVALFLIWILFTKPKPKKTVKDLPAANQHLNLNKVQGLAEETANNTPLNITVTKSEPNAALDNLAENLAIEKSTVQPEVSQTKLVGVDKIQHFISVLQHLDNCDLPTSVQTALKRKAIWHLAKVEDYYSIEPLLEAMPQTGVLDKNLILEAVMQINQHSYQPINNQLFADLHHPNPEVRLKALRDLRNLYQFVSPIITKIAQMQSDQDYEVRQSASQILRQLNASPLPAFYDYSEKEKDDLIVGEESGGNLHLVAYLLEELDAER